MKSNKMMIVAAFALAFVLAVPVAVGIFTDNDEVAADSVEVNDGCVATIDNVKYESLSVAWNAALGMEGPAVIELQKNSIGVGIGSDYDKKNKDITIDFNGFVYTIDSNPVGSSGTETQGFHLISGNDITMINGTITSTANSGVKMLVQNYGDLTLTDMKLDGSNLDPSNMDYYTLSNNSGNVIMSGATEIIAKSSDLGNKIGYAFDVDKTANVIVNSGTYLGKIAYTGNGNFAIIGGAFTDLFTAVKYAEENSAISLAANASGVGIGLFDSDVGSDKIGSKSITINFNNHTYTVTNGATGSGTAYKTQALHLESGCGKFTLMNGTLTSTSGSGVKMLVQNYCDLELINMTLDGSNLDPSGMDYYTLSNNSGNVIMNGATQIIAKSRDLGNKIGYAFDVDKTADVTIGSGTYVGKIAYTGTGDFVINGGAFTDLFTAVKFAKSGSIIELAGDSEGVGIGLFDSDVGGNKIGSKSLTIDFNYYTYTVTNDATGSGTAYKTQAMHLESGCGKFTLMNGTLTSASGSGVKMLVQNYCDLELINMKLDGSNLDPSNMDYYTLSNNSGNIVIDNNEIIAKSVDLGDKIGYAFDVDKTANVTVNYGSYTGKIAYTGTGDFVINGGAFTDLFTAVKYASSGSTIELAGDSEGVGIGLFDSDVGGNKIGSKSITINFNNYTYTVTNDATGSGTAYKTQAMHLESGCGKFTLMNGTLTSASGSGVKMLVQNYCDLELLNMRLDGSNLDPSNMDYYTLSNNSGNVVMRGITQIIAKSGDLGDKIGYAFDVDKTANVTVKSGTYVGKIAYTGTGDFVIENGAFSDISFKNYMSGRGSVSIISDSSIEAGDSLEIPKGVIFTIPSTVTLTSNGSIDISGVMVVNGLFSMAGGDVTVNAGGKVLGANEQNILSVGENGSVKLTKGSNSQNATISSTVCNNLAYSVMPDSGFIDSKTGTLNNAVLGNITFKVYAPSKTTEPTSQPGKDVKSVVDGSTSGTVTTTTGSDGKVKEVKTELKDTVTGVETKAVKTDAGSEIKTSIPSSAVKTENGAVATIDDSVIESALKQIDLAAKDTGIEDVKPVVDIVVTGGDKGETTVELSSEALKSIADAGADVGITSDSGTIVLDSSVASKISENAGDVSVMLGQASPSDLNEKQKEIAGDNAVIKIEVTAGDTPIHELDGKATISVPYTLREGEDPENIVIYYLDDNGDMTEMKATYDLATKEVSFETTHFSYYMVAFNDGSSSSFDMTLVLIVIGVLVILAIVAVAYYRHSHAA